MELRGKTTQEIKEMKKEERRKARKRRAGEKAFDFDFDAFITKDLKEEVRENVDAMDLVLSNAKLKGCTAKKDTDAEKVIVCNGYSKKNKDIKLEVKAREATKDASEDQKGEIVTQLGINITEPKK